MPEETLRDKFAMAALTGYLSALSLNLAELAEPEEADTLVKIFASSAYEMADAMLAEREKSK